MGRLGEPNPAIVELAREDVIGSTRDAMRDGCVSQAELGRALGKSQGHVSNILSGHGNPKLRTLLEILVPLGKTLEVVDLEERWY